MGEEDEEDAGSGACSTVPFSPSSWFPSLGRAAGITGDARGESGVCERILFWAAVGAAVAGAAGGFGGVMESELKGPWTARGADEVELRCKLLTPAPGCGWWCCEIGVGCELVVRGLWSGCTDSRCTRGKGQ